MEVYLGVETQFFVFFFYCMKDLPARSSITPRRPKTVRGWWRGGEGGGCSAQREEVKRAEERRERVCEQEGKVKRYSGFLITT